MPHRRTAPTTGKRSFFRSGTTTRHPTPIRWPSGKARDCNSRNTGSTPVRISPPHQPSQDPERQRRCPPRNPNNPSSRPTPESDPDGHHEPHGPRSHPAITVDTSRWHPHSARRPEDDPAGPMHAASCRDQTRRAPQPPTRPAREPRQTGRAGNRVTTPPPATDGAGADRQRSSRSATHTNHPTPHQGHMGRESVWTDAGLQNRLTRFDSSATCQAPRTPGAATTAWPAGGRRAQPPGRSSRNIRQPTPTRGSSSSWQSTSLAGTRCGVQVPGAPLAIHRYGTVPRHLTKV